MKGTRIGAIFLGLMVFGGAHSALPQDLDRDYYYEDAVEFKDGEISVAFERTPVILALSAIKARTGFQIVVPAAVENQLVSLRLDHQALEPAFRSLISSIGFNNFALMYDAAGRPHKAVVLDAQPELPASDAISEDTLVERQPLGKGEKEELQRDLERWSDLKQEERGRIEDRLKSLPPSDEREELLQEFGRQILGLKK